MRPRPLEPGPGQESVWDYPRPPRVEPTGELVEAYLDVVGDGLVAERAAWYYPRPTAPFASLVDHVAVYPGRMDRCLVDGEVVQPQPGGFYGGWITSRVVGPFKGVPGSTSW